MVEAELSAQLDAVNAKWVAAMAAGDAAAAAAQFAPDGVFVSPDAIVTRGFNELQELFHCWIDDGFINQTYSEVQVVRLGESVLVVGIQCTTVCNEDGTIYREKCRKTQLFAKDPVQGWKVQLSDIGDRSL